MSMRGRYIRCTTVSGTKEEKWEALYGSTLYGNLPPHKKHHHVGHCWLPCPYDTICSGTRMQHLIGTTNPAEGQILHEVVGKHYYMRSWNKGARWGFECTFDGCPYNTTYGSHYFYT